MNFHMSCYMISAWEVIAIHMTISKIPFFPLSSACGLASAPEATLRCTSQPRRALTRPSSGYSRPRRPWMRRTKTAVASDEDLGGNLTRHGSYIFFQESLPKQFGSDIWCCVLLSRLYRFLEGFSFQKRIFRPAFSYRRFLQQVSTPIMI